MKRFHVHLRVPDLQQSIAFYNCLFAAEPTRIEADYAKWMLTDPPVNFAISTRGGQPGLDHLGIQADNADELAELKARARVADQAVLDEGETTCCYARSDKHWVIDPQGVAWEHFQTLGSVAVFGHENLKEKTALSQSCCAPSVAERVANKGCCAPSANGGCC